MPFTHKAAWVLTRQPRSNASGVVSRGDKASSRAWKARARGSCCQAPMHTCGILATKSSRFLKNFIVSIPRGRKGDQKRLPSLSHNFRSLVWHRDHQVRHEHCSEPTVRETWRGLGFSEIQNQQDERNTNTNCKQTAKTSNLITSPYFWERFLVACAVQLEIL